MKINFNSIILKRFEVKLLIYLGISTLFFYFVAYEDVYNSTELGNQYKTLRIFADHPTYVNDYRDYKDYIFLFLLNKINYSGPFFIIWLTGDNLVNTFIFNIICLILSVGIINKTNNFNMDKYIIFLLINPITFVSIFSVNKEVVSLLSVSLFVSLLIKFRVWKFFICVFIAFLSRKELSFLFLLLYFIFIFFPKWKENEYKIYIIIVMLISLGSYYINENFSSIGGYSIEVKEAVENAGSAGTIILLNDIQNKYGYYLVVIPKIILNIYGSVLTRTYQMINFQDVYNDVVVWGQSFLFLFILPKSVYQIWKNNTFLQKQLFFSFIVSSIIFSYIPVVQNRYFYSSYLLLALIISIEQRNDISNKRLKLVP